MSKSPVRAAANRSAWCARSPASPESSSGWPTTTSVTSCSRTRSAIARTSAGAPVRTVPSGTAILRAPSEIATPIRASPRSSPRTRPDSPTGLEQFLQTGLDRIEGLLERVPFRAAGEREVRLAARTPADDPRGGFEQRRRGDAPADQVLGARGNEEGLAALPGP